MWLKTKDDQIVNVCNICYIYIENTVWWTAIQLKMIDGSIITYHTQKNITDIDSVLKDLLRKTGGVV
jgi:hypothetical protein